MPRIWSKTTKHFSSLAKFFSLKRYSHRERIVLLCVLFVGVFLVAAPAHAILTEVFNALVRFFIWIMLALSKIFIALSIFALKMFIEIAQYNNYVNTHTVVLGWAMVRDVANMFFVMILLVIAFATILGIEQYEWKKTLVKLILAAIFINFSKLICGIIIDFAHVFTITFLSAVSATAGGNLIQMFHLEKIHKLTGTGTDEGVFSGKIDTELFVASVIAFVFAGLTFLSMAAYMVVLIARVVVLWVLIILSPLAFILQVLPTTQQYAKEWWSKFTKQVIVAPVMVFFLWLSFATLGNGKFATDTEDAGGMGMDMALAKGEDIPKLSMSDVSSWENMANFLIGAAFLWVGIGVVQKLGVVGGEMVPGMIGFGKKVATIATGYAAGRKLAGEGAEKGFEGAKFAGGAVLKKTPYVGGAALKEYGAGIKSRYQRKGLLGAVTGGRVSGIGGYESQIKRSDMAKKLERKGPLGWLAARAIEPSQRSEKRASDWQVTAERAKKIRDESYGTSQSRAGQAKIDTTVELQNVEKRAQSKGAFKTAERTQEALAAQEVLMSKAGGDMEVAARMKKDKSVMKEVEQEVIKIVAGNNKEKAEKMQRFIKRDGGIKARVDLGIQLEQIRQGYAGAQSGTEESQKYARRQEELVLASERDSIVTSQGGAPRFYQQALEKQQKEMEEEMSGLNFREITKQGEDLVKRISEAGASPVLRRNLTSTLTAAFKRGSESGMSAFNNIKQAAGFQEEVESDDLLGKQRELLTVLLGRKVEKGITEDEEKSNIAQAFDEFNETHGDNAQAILKNLDTALKVSASDGAVNLAGVFNDRELDDNGRVKFVLETDRENFKGNRKYFAEEVNLSKITGVDDIVNKGADGKTTLHKANGDIDETAKMQLTVALSSAKGNTPFNNRFIQSMQALNANDEVGLREVLGELNQTARESIEKILQTNNQPATS